MMEMDDFNTVYIDISSGRKLRLRVRKAFVMLAVLTLD